MFPPIIFAKPDDDRVFPVGVKPPPFVPPIAFCWDNNFRCIAKGSKIGGERSKSMSCPGELGIPETGGMFIPKRRELGSMGGSKRPHLEKSGNFGICFGGGNTAKIRTMNLLFMRIYAVHSLYGTYLA